MPYSVDEILNCDQLLIKAIVQQKLSCQSFINFCQVREFHNINFGTVQR